MEFGPAKDLDDITLDDVLRNPIWVWALDEEENEDQDETWQKPITSTTDLTSEMAAAWLTLRIAVKVVGSELHGSAEYDHSRRELDAIAVWQDDSWVGLPQVRGLVAPLVFEAVPTIEGEGGVRFTCDAIESERAGRSG